MAFVASLALRGGGSPFLAGRRLLCPTSRTAAFTSPRFLFARATAAAPSVPAPSATSGPPLSAVSRTSSTTRSSLSSTRFADLGLIPPLQRALDQVFSYDTATAVQERSLPSALAGADVLVKAKTGTGKTLAFSLPALQRVLSSAGAGGETVRILVLSPTRELALQIAAEAASLATYADGFTIQTVVGGTNVRTDVNRFRAGMPTMLIATPGRLMDHLETPSTGLARALQGLDVLVLDEADRLMDMGFRPSVERILRQVPSADKRQTMLFSATMPADVRDMTRLALKPTHEVIDCVGEDTATHAKVMQKVVVAPMEQTVAALKVVIDQLVAAAPEDFKIMVFFPTARQCQCHAELWRAMAGEKGAVPENSILEIHSRKTQANRTRTAGTFRSGKRIILFSSDVTARGMDFPDVTAVVQFGRPSDREQYVHRLGRTARGDGLIGRGVLVLGEFEARGVSKLLKDLPVSTEQLEDMPLAIAANEVGYGFRQVASETKEQTYQATLGYYKQFTKSLGQRGMDATELVATINSWALDVAGCEEVPELQARTVGKMGLRGTAGLRIGGRGGMRKVGTGGGGRGGGGGGERQKAIREGGGDANGRNTDGRFSRHGSGGRGGGPRGGGRDVSSREGRVGGERGGGERSFRGSGDGSAPTSRGGGAAGRGGGVRRGEQPTSRGGGYAGRGGGVGRGEGDGGRDFSARDGRTGGEGGGRTFRSGGGGSPSSRGGGGVRGRDSGGSRGGARGGGGGARGGDW